MNKVFNKINLTIARVFPKLGIKLIAQDKNKNAPMGIKMYKWLKKNNAKLNVYTTADYAWIDIDGFRLYFHSNGKEKVTEKEIETFSGKKKKLKTIPFDGWEC